MHGLKKRLWQITIMAAIALIVITFTPLVTPYNKYNPRLFGFPYTLWTGMLVSIGLVLLTVIGSILHRRANKKKRHD
jgi:Na+/melibiose symporter-like transporter